MVGNEAIVIAGLKKTFTSMLKIKPEVQAVKGVSLKMYPGEITAILGRTYKANKCDYAPHPLRSGHNGAGKTTLFNMLTGMTSVTSGNADIFGYVHFVVKTGAHIVFNDDFVRSYDVRDPNDMALIRRMTGICPQHDVLFDELTPKEHLQFFARIRV